MAGLRTKLQTTGCYGIGDRMASVTLVTNRHGVTIEVEVPSTEVMGLDGPSARQSIAWDEIPENVDANVWVRLRAEQLAAELCGQAGDAGQIV